MVSVYDVWFLNTWIVPFQTQNQREFCTPEYRNNLNVNKLVPFLHATTSFSFCLISPFTENVTVTPHKLLETELSIYHCIEILPLYYMNWVGDNEFPNCVQTVILNYPPSFHAHQIIYCRISTNYFPIYCKFWSTKSQSSCLPNLFHFPRVNFNISCPSTILPFFLIPSCSCIIKNDLRWHESCLFTLRWAMIKSVWILCPSSSSSSSTAPWILLWLKWSWPRVCHGIAWFPVPRLSSLLPRQRWSSCYSWCLLPSSSMLGNR